MIMLNYQAFSWDVCSHNLPLAYSQTLRRTVSMKEETDGLSSVLSIFVQWLFYRNYHNHTLRFSLNTIEFDLFSAACTLLPSVSWCPPAFPFQNLQLSLFFRMLEMASLASCLSVAAYSSTKADFGGYVTVITHGHWGTSVLQFRSQNLCYHMAVIYMRYEVTLLFVWGFLKSSSIKRLRLGSQDFWVYWTFGLWNLALSLSSQFDLFCQITFFFSLKNYWPLYKHQLSCTETHTHSSVWRPFLSHEPASISAFKVLLYITQKLCLHSHFVNKTFFSGFV